MKEFDLIVVGGGILGAFHAYHALALGKSVALFEKSHEPQGATVRNFGQVVPSGMNAYWQEIGRESLSIYKNLQSKFDFTARQNGTVYLASNEEELTLVEELHAINRNNSYPSIILSASECLQRYPGLQSSYCIGGLFFPEEITLESRVAIARFLRYMENSMGLTYFPNTQVTAMETTDARVYVASGSTTRYIADRVVICNGSDFSVLFPEIFAESELIVTKLHMLETEIQPTQRIPGSILTGLTIRRYESFHECPSWAAIKAREPQDSLEKRWGVHILFKQSVEGSVIIGDSHEYAPAARADQLGFDLNENINRFMLAEAQKIFELETWQIARSWYGQYAQCKASDVFRHTIDNRIHIITGIGGKGMTASPAYARLSINQIFN